MSSLLARWSLPGIADPVRPMHVFALWLQRHHQRESQALRIEAHRGLRSLDQNAKLHALCADLAKTDLTWNGRRRDRKEWKVLLVSGHAHVTSQGQNLGELACGLEGELVYLRESTAQMATPRASSLIEYALAFCALHDVALSDPHEALQSALQTAGLTGLPNLAYLALPSPPSAPSCAPSSAPTPRSLS